jgi:glyoxylase-like metal-dependent hydrolase (beta-lactamase superfamily II)
MNAEAAEEELRFDRSSVGAPGELQSLTPLVRRMLADNPGPMTFSGTCTYVIGHGKVAIIDPGPALASHVQALLQALRNETVTHILVTHTHRDHCGAAAVLQAATGAKILGCAPHMVLALEESEAVDSAHDVSYRPDAVLGEGDSVTMQDFALAAVATPGHTGNHLSFALAEEAALFTGDHVMAWSTSVVIPPDGSMADYMASLEKLQRRCDQIYWPGHGAPVRAPQPYVSALIRHRRQREAAILAALAEQARTPAELVGVIYLGLDPALHGAAQLSLRAHLEDLAGRGRVGIDAVDATGQSGRRYRLI